MILRHRPKYFDDVTRRSNEGTGLTVYICIPFYSVAIWVCESVRVSPSAHAGPIAFARGIKRTVHGEGHSCCHDQNVSSYRGYIKVDRKCSIYFVSFEYRDRMGV